MTFSSVFIVNYEQISHYSCVFIVEFKRVNAGSNVGNFWMVCKLHPQHFKTTKNKKSKATN